MKVKDTRPGDTSKMSTLDYLVTRMKRHVRSSSVDSCTSPATTVIVEDEVDMRVSEDEGAVEAEDASLPAPHHRPPMYNPEDYATALTKYSKVPHLYMPEPPTQKKGRGREKEKAVTREAPQEMSLKQFSSLPELLKKLREDLKMSYLSFVKELVREPHDGVTLLLDALKTVQLAQTDLNGVTNSREQQIALRRALIDEHECLSCLRYCLRCTDAALKLAHYKHGLYALAVAVMSNLARSRTLALQLLTKACITSTDGHRQVVEALATLRLRFAEPVKCKFLVSMMLSHPHPSFQVWGLRFINALVTSTRSLREKIYLQEELAEAGFDAATLRKMIERSGSDSLQQQSLSELNRWCAAYIDVGTFQHQITGLQTSNTTLQEELQKLREANMKLLEENILLKAVGGEVEERYAALQRRLHQNGIPAAPSPAPSVSDSDLSSLNTFRKDTMRRTGSVSPSRHDGVHTSITETDSVIFTKGEDRSLTPVWDSRSKSSFTASTRSQASTTSDETITSSRPASVASPPVPRSRRQSASTPEPLAPPPATSSAAPQPRTNGHARDDSGSEASSHSRASSAQGGDRKRPGSCERFNEHMPPANIDMTFRVDKRSSTATPDSQRDRRHSSPDAKHRGHDKHHKSRQRQQIPDEPPPPLVSSGTSESEARPSSSPTQPDSRPGSKSSSAPSKTSSPFNTKRKAPSPPGTSSPFSSSTSSLSSSSSTSSSSGGGRKDPEYMNVPLRPSPASTSRSTTPHDRRGDEGDLDYERDVVVYEAITLANERIFVDRNNTQGSRGSGKSQCSAETKGADEDSADGPSVRESVRHYENLVMRHDLMEERRDAKVEERKDGRVEEKRDAKVEEWREAKVDEERKEDARREGRDGISDKKRERSNNERREKRSDKGSGERRGRREENRHGDVSEKEVEAVMSGLENVLRSAESSLSLASQETVKENPLLKDSFEDRASPDMTEELEIVPTRVPQLPSRSRSRNSQGGSTPRDPVLFLEFESPAETSDTETLLRANQPLPSPRTIETESVKSFGFVRPEKPLRRTETFADRSSSEREPQESRRRIKRSESFQLGNKADYQYSPRRRGSTDLLVPLEEKEVHISGRTFTKYTPHEVERRNRVNELITAEMNRRKNRSMEDRLDQWFENQADNDWTLRWKYPEIHHDLEEKFSRQSRAPESRSPPRYEDTRHKAKGSAPKYPGDLPGPPAKPSRGGKPPKFSNAEISAFNGFKNPNKFRESDYGPNFMLNKPSRLPDFSELTEYGGRDYPPPRTRGLRDAWLAGNLRRKADIDPDIPSPDYSATPAGTMSTTGPAKHILDMPSGLY